MATAPTFPLVPLDEYLNSSWHPDMEYVAGMLVERPVPTVFHTLLQLILAAHFRAVEKQYRVKTLIETRTQIIAGDRYRIPDVQLCPRPIPKGRIIDARPVVAIEILSPDDKVTEVLQRFRDFERLGVQHIIQMDPEDHIAHRFEGGSLIETRFNGLHLANVGATIPFDSEALFEQLRREHEEATTE